MVTEEWLTTKDIARRLDVSESTVRYWVMTGVGPPSYTFGRLRRFLAADVDQWITDSRDRERSVSA